MKPGDTFNLDNAIALAEASDIAYDGELPVDVARGNQV